MLDTVSVIIPCFNVQDFIEECIDSVVSQTYTNIEIICIDNNSKDKTLDKLNILIEKYPQLVIVKEPKLGAPVARNKGLSLAKGEWIQFLDADDLLKPSKIEHQIELLSKENNKNAMFIAASSLKQNQKGEQKIHHPESNEWKGVFSTNLGNTCANLFNKEALLGIGGWNEKLQSSQEYDLMFRLIKIHGTPIIDTEILTIIRERESGQISQRNPKEKWKQYLNLRLEIMQFLKEEQKEEWEKNQEYYLNKFFSKLRPYSTYDLEDAISIYHSVFPDNFVPKKGAHSSALYIALLKIIGFERTERLRSRFKKK